MIPPHEPGKVSQYDNFILAGIGSANELNDAMEEFLIHLQAVINHMKPVVEKIIQILDGTIEPYKLNEMLHPRKKPRGSIRRRSKTK